MLIQRFINTLPNRKDRNIEDFRRSTQLRSRSKKNGRRENIFFFKTNVLVPREEGATVAATPYLLLSKTVRAVDGRAGRANRDFSKPLGETH